MNTMLWRLVDEVSKLNPSKYSKKDQQDDAEKMAKLAEKVKYLKMQQRHSEQQHQMYMQQMQMQQRQHGPGFVDIVSSIGQGAGMILASPAIGAASLLKKTLN